MRLNGVSREESQHGAVALIVAVSMVALCAVAAMVIDLGLIRIDRQQNKSAADAAAKAGVSALITSNTTTEFHPYRGVCQALRYLQVNSPEFSSFASTSWTDGDGAPSVADGCASSMESEVCDTATYDRSTWARFVGTSSNGKLRVRIQSGYEVDETDEGGFSEEALPALATDDGDAAYAGCDQLAVIISEVRGTTLGAVAASSMAATSRSVGRIDVLPPKAPIALLILERTDCEALAVTSAGALGRIDVAGHGSHPGLIHVDSDGTGSNCGPPSGAPIIKGKNAGTCPDPAFPPPTCGGVVAHESEDGTEPGLITTVGTADTSDGIPRVFSGPYAAATGPEQRDLVTRNVVDEIYLNGVSRAVTMEANPAFAAAAADTAPAGYTTTNCNTTGKENEPKLFIRCANFTNAATLTGTEFIFTGQVNANNLFLPNAERVFIVGGTSPAGMSVSDFRMHHRTASSCSPTESPTESRARLFLLGGDMKVSGSANLQMCNTTLILMGGLTSACLPTTPSLYTDEPCPGIDSGPYDNAGNGTITVTGGAHVDWTAPNLTDGESIQTQLDDLEDLALWAETYGAFDIGGGGGVTMNGVFMAPNADPFKIAGGAGQNVENSQYIVRRLWNPGNGRLYMKPLSTLPIKMPELHYSLVR